MFILIPGDEPQLSELHRFTKMDGKHLNLAEEIGDEYRHFGACLMQDSDGSIVDGMVSRLGDVPQRVNGEVLKEWSLGKGKVPVEWATVLECLREVSLYELETEIKEEMDDVPGRVIMKLTLQLA